jgi:Swt1-like HEPN
LALSSRERVGRALEILSAGLAPFVDRHMAAFLPRGRDWLETMADRARREGRAGKLSRSDPRVLLRVIAQNPAAFREPLSRLELAYVREIAEVANQWAHLEPFSDADSTRALDTMIRLLHATGAQEQAGQIVELLPAPVARERDGAGAVSPAVAPRTTQSLESASVPSEQARPNRTVVEFRDCDGDYLAWVAAHGSGYVINIGRSGRGPAMLHRADCRTITNRPPFTDAYMKVCAPSAESLDGWVLQHNGTHAQRCGVCHPPSAHTSAGKPAPQDLGHTPVATAGQHGVASGPSAKARRAGSTAFGREEADWDVLAAAGEDFLIECARLGRLTSYTELNTALERRTGLRRFDFALHAERAAMGHLLGLIVKERNRPATGLMISALVIYIDGNDAGPGFYKLAQDMGKLPPGTLSSHLKEEFWIGQVKALYAYYSKHSTGFVNDG